MMCFCQKNDLKWLKYREFLAVVASLSKLFSESSKPFLHYRVMENLFCESFGATNLSRSDTAYDAKFGTLGIGLKTFLCDKFSIEKVAEFNKESLSFKNLHGTALAYKLANLRNERIRLANELYGITEALYHIIARQQNRLVFFETDYKPINIANLRVEKETQTSLFFFDGENQYIFNRSKSVLQRKFIIPKNFDSLDVEILQNPFEILLSLKDKFANLQKTTPKKPCIDYVMLPLFSTKGESKFVAQKSGLNFFNAGGRERNSGEVYVPIPALIRKFAPTFFPKRDESFCLSTPMGEKLEAKICQDDAKALMTNPNSALSNWLLRKVLGLKEWEILTLEHLQNLNVDSVIVEKIHENENFSEAKNGKKCYRIDICPWGSYEKFVSEICLTSEVCDEK